jgi:hypothetical protein
MLMQHWVLVVVMLVIGYILGVKFPQWGASVGL